MAKPKLSYKKVDIKRATTVRIKIQVLNSYKCIRITENNIKIQIINTPKIMVSLPGAPSAGSNLLGGDEGAITSNAPFLASKSFFIREYVILSMI